jgi:hypothetical protein
LISVSHTLDPLPDGCVRGVAGGTELAATRTTARCVALGAMVPAVLATLNILPHPPSVRRNKDGFFWAAIAECLAVVTGPDGRVSLFGLLAITQLMCLALDAVDACLWLFPAVIQAKLARPPLHLLPATQLEAEPAVADPAAPAVPAEAGGALSRAASDKVVLLGPQRLLAARELGLAVHAAVVAALLLWVAASSVMQCFHFGDRCAFYPCYIWLPFCPGCTDVAFEHSLCSIQLLRPCTCMLQPYRCSMTGVWHLSLLAASSRPLRQPCSCTGQGF